MKFGSFNYTFCFSILIGKTQNLDISKFFIKFFINKKYKIIYIYVFIVRIYIWNTNKNSNKHKIKINLIKNVFKYSYMQYWFTFLYFVNQINLFNFRAQVHVAFFVFNTFSRFGHYLNIPIIVCVELNPIGCISLRNNVSRR